jgi:hypothetical protein
MDSSTGPSATKKRKNDDMRAGAYAGVSEGGKGCLENKQHPFGEIKFSN